MGKVLTDAEIARYHRDGFLSPIDAFGPGEARGFRARLEDFERRDGRQFGKGHNFRPQRAHRACRGGGPLPCAERRAIRPLRSGAMRRRRVAVTRRRLALLLAACLALAACAGNGSRSDDNRFGGFYGGMNGGVSTGMGGP